MTANRAKKSTIGETAEERKNRKYANEFNTSFLAAKSPEEVLFGGVTSAIGAELFHIHESELRALIEVSGTQPIGMYGRGKLYSIYDLAGLCVSPTWTEEEWENILSRRHFPAQLVKEFWAAKKARQDFLLTAGDLWGTDEVVSVLSEVFKTISMGIKLVTDNIDRETSITPQQRTIFNELVDAALAGAAKQIEDVFSSRVMLERVKRFEELTGEKIYEAKGTTKESFGTSEREISGGAETIEGSGSTCDPSDL